MEILTSTDQQWWSNGETVFIIPLLNNVLIVFSISEVCEMSETPKIFCLQ